jgi:hypothetical protein
MHDTGYHHRKCSSAHDAHTRMQNNSVSWSAHCTYTLELTNVICADDDFEGDGGADAEQPAGTSPTALSIASLFDARTQKSKAHTYILEQSSLLHIPLEMVHAHTCVPMSNRDFKTSNKCVCV